MSKFYFVLHATTGDNALSLDAKNEDEAKQKVADTWGDFVLDPKVTTISVEFISKARFTTEVKRIAKARLEEAERIEQPKEG